MESQSAFSMYKNRSKVNLKRKTIQKKKKNSSKKMKRKNLEPVALNLLSGNEGNSTENGIEEKKKNENKKQTVIIPNSEESQKKKGYPKINTKVSTSGSLDRQSLDFYKQPNQVFEMIIAPLTPNEFFKTYWEKRPVFIKRNNENYYNKVLTTEKLNKILCENSLFYTRNVDVVSYENGKRETHNPEGRAVSSALWDYYSNGCSIRILNPHTYSNNLHILLTALQEYFGCMAGINAYLTPPGSQGFAPHYDDIEAFVLQLEGRKHWKLYRPLTESEVLPRFSSKNLDRKDLQPPMKEETLEAGDLLYFPRGIIHEGFTDKDAHSLHITVSVYQRTAYVDLLERILKPALEAASQDDVEFREGLPLQYLKHVGLANSNNSSNVRSEIIGKVEKLFGKMLKYISVDAGADQLGKQFMWDAMPPVPLKQERVCMVHENGDTIKNGVVANTGYIDLDVRVRLLRYHCIWLVEEEKEIDTSERSIRIYYSTENAKYYHGEEQQFLDIKEVLSDAVKYLLQKYPEFVTVRTLPVEEDDAKMQIISDLWERGLLVTEKPLSDE